MRILLAMAVLGFGIAGGTARAADLPLSHSEFYSTDYFEHGQRSAMQWFYDDEPGTVVRAYWLAPWRYHHYFPATGRRPMIGRRENLSAVSHPAKPSKTFRRSWSNAWALAHETPSAAPAQSNAESESAPVPRHHRLHHRHFHPSH